MKSNLRIHHFIRACLCGVFLNVALVAAVPGGKDDKSPPIQSVQLVVFGPMSATFNAEHNFYCDTATGEQSIPLANGTIAGPFLRERSPVFSLFGYVQEPIPPEKRVPGGPEFNMVRQEMTQVNIPITWKNVMVLVRMQGSRVVGATPIDQSINALPEGHVVIHNFSSQDVALRLGDLKTVVKAKDKQIAQLNTPSGRPQTVLAQIAIQRDGDWTLVDSSGTFIHPGKRAIFLLLPSQAGATLFKLPFAADDPPEPDDTRVAQR